MRTFIKQRFKYQMNTLVTTVIKRLIFIKPYPKQKRNANFTCLTLIQDIHVT